MITGEASPYYLFHPLVSERIYKDNPEIKLIVLLRNPITRAYSHYQMEKKKGNDKISSFEEAIYAEPNRVKGESLKLKKRIIQKSWNHQTYSYLSRGEYTKQLEEWFKYFKRDQFLFIKSEDFFDDPIKTFKNVCKFLQIPFYKPADIAKVNKGTYDQIIIEAEAKKYLDNFFKKDQKELCKLIGNKFSWDESK